MSTKERMTVLADGWVELSKVTIVGRKPSDEESASYERLFWAAEAFWRLIERRPELALQVICDILKRTEEEGVLGHLAAGPLEDLLAENNPHITDTVEMIAATDQRFRGLLRMVWRNAMSDETWARVKAARQ